MCVSAGVIKSVRAPGVKGEPNSQLCLSFPLTPWDTFVRVLLCVCVCVVTHDASLTGKEGLTPVLSERKSVAHLIIRGNLKPVIWPSEVRLHTVWICVLFSPHRPAFYGQIITPARQMDLFLNPWHLSFHLVKSPWKDFRKGEQSFGRWLDESLYHIQTDQSDMLLLNLTC